MALNNLPECPSGARLVPLKGGQFSIVDEEDYPIAMAWKWQCHDGYAVGSYGSRLHRLILGNPSTNLLCDHINRNRLDNRKSNLRLVTYQQNSRNRVRANLTGYQGVHVDKTRFTVMVDGKHVGAFKTAIEGARAYDAVARDAHGEHACLNFPDEYYRLIKVSQMGAQYDKNTDAWRARFSHKGIVYELGEYPTKEEALAVVAAKKETIGLPLRYRVRVERIVPPAATV